MLLLTIREWLGPSRQRMRRPAGVPTDSRVRLRGFVTELPLPQAIERLAAYVAAYNQHYTETAVNFSLVMVTMIEPLAREHLRLADMELIEELRVTFAS